MGTVLMAASIMFTPATTAFAAESDYNMSEIVIENPTDFLDEIDIPTTSSIESNNLSEISDEEAGIEPAWLFEKKYKVTGNNVNIRAGAGTKYDVVGTLYKGDIIYVKSIDNGWAKFKYNDQWRYVSSTYIKAA